MTTPDAVAGLDLNQDSLSDQNRLEQLVGPEWYRLLKGVVTNPLSVAGLIIVAIFILTALFAPTLAPAPNENWDPYKIPRDGFKPEPLPPGSPWNQNVPANVPGWYSLFTGNEEWVHLMGTTSGQYDIWYGIVWGARTALSAGTAVVAISALFGILVGSIAGFYGGWVDEVMMRIVEIFIVFPSLVAVLVLSSILVPIFGQSLWPAMIALIVFGWMGYARLLRGDILSNKERDYVLAAQASGAKDTPHYFEACAAQCHLPHPGFSFAGYGGHCTFLCSAEFPGRGRGAGLCGLGPNCELCPRLDPDARQALVHCAVSWFSFAAVRAGLEPDWGCAA